jgi:hypothetical protein
MSQVLHLLWNTAVANNWYTGFRLPIVEATLVFGQFTESLVFERLK